MKEKHQHKITVTPADIDGMGHVNNVVYLRWVQEVAESHWYSAAKAEYTQKYQWVVLRHEIIGETWIESLEGARSIRLVELKRGDVILAKARTTWVMLDAQTGRPARVPKDMQEQFL